MEESSRVSETIEIIRWLHPHSSVWRTVAVLRGYFDDSGTHAGSRVVAIGGFVAREEQWEQFEAEWKRLLARYGIRFFHMADLESRKEQFQGWSEENKRQLISDVTVQVGKWAKHAISGLVIARDYEEVVPKWARETAAFGDAYNFCFQMCVAQAMDYVERLDPPMPQGDKIAFMFEQQSKHEGITRSNYSLIKEFRDPTDRMGAFGFGTKLDFRPLQLADFFAYESYKQLDNIVEKSGRDIRVPLKILLNAGQSIQAHYFNREKLEWLVRYYDSKGRPSKGNEPWWPWTGGIE